MFANPENKAAKELLADAYELRNGVPQLAASGGTASPDVIKAMPPEMLFEYLSVRLDGAKGAGKEYGLSVENGVLKYDRLADLEAEGRLPAAAQARDHHEDRRGPAAAHGRLHLEPRALVQRRRFQRRPAARPSS